MHVLIQGKHIHSLYRCFAKYQNKIISASLKLPRFLLG